MVSLLEDHLNEDPSLRSLWIKKKSSLAILAGKKDGLETYPYLQPFSSFCDA